MILVGVKRVSKGVFINIDPVEDGVDEVRVIGAPFFSLSLMNGLEETFENLPIISLVKHVREEVIEANEEEQDRLHD